MPEYRKRHRENLWPVLGDAVKGGKMGFLDAEYFQGIVESGIISDAQFKQIINSGVRPESVGKLAALVRTGKLDARKMREQLLEAGERKVPRKEISNLLSQPSGRFFETLNWLDHIYKLPQKFKYDLITKRLREKKAF